MKVIHKDAVGRRNFIDPVTIGVIIGAISAVVGWLDHQTNVAAKKEVNEKLDLLIQICLQILVELKNLRIVIREELEAAFRNDDMRTLTALNRSAQDAIAGITNPNHIPPRTLKELGDSYTSIKNMTYKLQQYGYAPYAAVAAGTLATLQIGILISTPKDELLSALGHFRKYFTDAILDPNIQQKVTGGV
jgi:hypothetical protein